MQARRLAAREIACRRGDRLLLRGLSFALGACLALVLLGTGRLGRRARLAFGPFLSAGAYLSYIGGAAFWSAYEVLL